MICMAERPSLGEISDICYLTMCYNAYAEVQESHFKSALAWHCVGSKRRAKLRRENRPREFFEFVTNGYFERL